MNLYKSLVMKVEGFSCPYLYWDVSFRSLTNCVNFPTAQETKDVLSLVRKEASVFSMSSRGFCLISTLTCAIPPSKLGKRRLFQVG